jgi:membrane protein YqaA with SNARE-associated domain
MKNESIKTGMKIGTTVGGLVFLVFGIMPGFYFGSFGTLLLLQKLMGGTVEPTLIARTVIVMGIVVGIACAAAASLVVGGLLGTALGYIVSAPSAKKEQQEATEKA